MLWMLFNLIFFDVIDLVVATDVVLFVDVGIFAIFNNFQKPRLDLMFIFL